MDALMGWPSDGDIAERDRQNENYNDEFEILGALNTKWNALF